MQSLLKSAVLGAGLLVGVMATAQAQSVAALPTGPAQAPSVTAPPVVSSAKIYPKPGANSTWREEHYTQTDADNAPARHPYTMPHFGPAPN
jgi:hypothetical protein